MSARFNNPFLQSKLIYRFTKKYTKEQTGRNFISQFQRKFFLKRQDEIRKQGEGKFQGFIDKLIVNKKNWSESSVQDNILLLLLAGFESEY